MCVSWLPRLSHPPLRDRHLALSTNNIAKISNLAGLDKCVPLSCGSFTLSANQQAHLPLLLSPAAGWKSCRWPGTC